MKITVICISSVALCIAGFVVLQPVKAAPGNATAQRQEVKVDNFTFSPDAVTVPVNSTVTWVNKDDLPHTVVANDGSFKSRALDTDQEFSHTFSKAGTYSYYCSVHPKMVGKIVVQ